MARPARHSRARVIREAMRALGRRAIQSETARSAAECDGLLAMPPVLDGQAGGRQMEQVVEAGQHADGVVGAVPALLQRRFHRRDVPGAGGTWRSLSCRYQRERTGGTLTKARKAGSGLVGSVKKRSRGDDASAT